MKGKNKNVHFIEMGKGETFILLHGNGENCEYFSGQMDEFSKIAVLENIMQQDRVMRHDRRHFETLLQTFLQEGNTQEALRCLNERLKSRTAWRKKVL